ncbi:MAG: O-acetylhomoserine aminocarboxypropyltransferase/cysteine synthase [Firmicutes bacterium]|nr:O-acetylhomoserine aminocarboxypropyltransferase/cysteine synthase [Bacillota bacterium]
MDELHLETLAVHGGETADPATAALVTPIYQTVAYAFADPGHAARLFNLEEPGNIYSRIMNPTVGVLENRIAALEGGRGALAFASGQAAITATVLNLCRSGDAIIASSHLYGGTFTLLGSTLADLGITVHFLDDDGSGERLEAAPFGPRTKAVYVETIGNPKLDIPDLERWAAVAHAHGVPLIVDNTFASPYLCRPFEAGADLVIHSLTKWLGGHGHSLGGIVVDSGRFDFTAGGYPQFTTPDPTYHGLVWGDRGPDGFLLRMRAKILRDTGAAISPLNAWLILQGVETLAVRMDRECANAAELARRLAAHPAVAWVNYPGLPDHPSHERARRYLRSGRFGSMLVFGLNGGYEAGRRVIERVRLFSHVANVGDVRSLIIHPASTTHGQLDPAEQAAAGVAPEAVRVSVGLEHVDDLWADLEQALT